MKNGIKIFLLSIIFTSPVINAGEPVQWYFGLSGGGDTNPNAGFSWGAVKNNWMWNISVIGDNDYATDELLDYPVPHNDYTVTNNDATVGNTMGFDGTKIIKLSETVSFLLGGGLYFRGGCEVAESNVTGWEYCQSNKDETIPSINTGLFLIAPDSQVGIRAHSYRGVELFVSWFN
ncbi:MAG: hypothetical protein OEY11_14565 [Gammaproteobacteria bacterium]|nr:hypothetical protein [Gammaproteobacteria bacterium]